LTYVDILERIQMVRDQIGDIPDLQPVIEAGTGGNLDEAAELLDEIETKAEDIAKERSVSQRIDSLVASDLEVTELRETLVREGPEATEPKLKTLEARAQELRLKAALDVPVKFNRFLGDWQRGVLYEPGDVVRSEGVTYIALTATKQKPPSKAWEPLTEAAVQMVVGMGGGGGGSGPPDYDGRQDFTGTPGGDGHYVLDGTTAPDGPWGAVLYSDAGFAGVLGGGGVDLASFGHGGVDLWNSEFDSAESFIKVRDVMRLFAKTQLKLDSPQVDINSTAAGSVIAGAVLTLQGTTNLGGTGVILAAIGGGLTASADGTISYHSTAGDVVFGTDDGVVRFEPSTFADFNSKAIKSVADPTDSQDAATKAYVDGRGSVPPGGTTGQVLVKASDADFDTEWADLP
jgi:hypothetical protein